MNENQWFPDSSFRDRLWLKLGSCPLCMRTSMRLALASWLGLAAASVVAGRAVVIPLAIASGLLTVWLATHVAAFFLKSSRAWRNVGMHLPEQPDDPGFRSRRRFLTASTAVLAGVLLAPFVRLASSGAVSLKSPARVNCLAGPPWNINLTTPPIIGCGRAGANETPGQAALRDFLRKVRQACQNAEPQENKKGICTQRKCTKVADDCVVKAPQGADFKNTELVLREKNANDPCPAADTHVLFAAKKKNGKDVGYMCSCDCV